MEWLRDFSSDVSCSAVSFEYAGTSGVVMGGRLWLVGDVGDVLIDVSIDVSIGRGEEGI